MAEILLASCAALPDGGPEAHLPELFAPRGVEAQLGGLGRPAPSIWSSADLVAIRTTWDYAEKLDSFISWTRVVAQQTRLVNTAEVIAWNTDKRYLERVARMGLRRRSRPTSSTTHRELEAALTSHDSAVVKPVVGVAGIGLVVWHRAMIRCHALTGRCWSSLLVESVRTHGEVSIFVMGGDAGATGREAARPMARCECTRTTAVATRWSRCEPRQPTSPLGAIGKVAARFGVDVPYGRVDLLRLTARWVIGEIEITEPGLYRRRRSGDRRGVRRRDRGRDGPVTMSSIWPLPVEFSPPS